MGEKGRAWKERMRREQDAALAATGAAQRILADDGTWTRGDAVLCAEYVLALRRALRERIAASQEQP